MLKLVREYSTKAELVYKTLMEAIVASKLTPGTRLIVREIADQLSVSDIPVREALKMLETTGLIQTQPYIGSVVTTPSAEWIEEVFVMRAALESMAIRTSLPFLEDTDIEEILAINAEMKHTAKSEDTAKYARLNREFHKVVMAKSPYPALLSMIDDLLVKSEYGKAIFNLKPTTVRISDSEHDRLLQAIRARNGAKAEAITRDHRLRVGRQLAQVIRAGRYKSSEKQKRSKSVQAY
ncbi:MAG: GntR family transcriptional regulator [Candidatus Korobacteraceae bacterium]